jgi:hypothetical protein
LEQTLKVKRGGTLTWSSSTSTSSQYIVNEGKFNLTGTGTLSMVDSDWGIYNKGTFDIRSDGRIEGAVGGMGHAAYLYNELYLVKSYGAGVTEISAFVTNHYQFTIETGRIRLLEGGAQEWVGVNELPQTMMRGGDLEMGNNRAFTVKHGYFKGTGTFTGVLYVGAPVTTDTRAWLQPGTTSLTYGTLNIVGSLVFFPNAILEIDVDGVTHDRVNVYKFSDNTGGSVSLGGRLQVNVPNRNVPVAGTELVFLTWAGTCTNDFAVFGFPTIDDLTFTKFLNYPARTYVLRVTRAT